MSTAHVRKASCKDHDYSAAAGIAEFNKQTKEEKQANEDEEKRFQMC